MKKIYIVKDSENQPVSVVASKASGKAYIKWFLRKDDYFVDYCFYDETKSIKDPSAFIGV